MTRSLSTPLAAEFQAQQITPVLLLELFFDSGTLRFWSGGGEITYLGNIFTGAANLLSISDYTEVQNLEARGMILKLSGIPSGLISLALVENCLNRVAKLYIGALDEAYNFIGTPYQIFSGSMDNMSIEESGANAAISVSVENRMAILTRSKPNRYTAEDQKSRFPSDKGLDFVALLQDRDIQWKAGN